MQSIFVELIVNHKSNDKIYWKTIYTPISTIEQNIEGKVHITLIVETNGKLSNISILMGIGSGVVVHRTAQLV